MSSSPKLILASRSPRRREFLERLGISFEAVPSEVDESVDIDAPVEVAQAIAEKKARAVAERFPEHYVLAADTIVVVFDPREKKEKILGQPKDDVESREMIELLSGREHTVYTAFVLMNKESQFFRTRIVDTRVWFRSLTPSEIDLYVKSGEGRDKAGAYGAQQLGACLISEIHGSYTNVIGLPLAELLEELKPIGFWDHHTEDERL